MNSAEEADRNALSVNGRHGCNADVKVALIDAYPSPAVLRQPPLRDVEVRENLDARHNRLAEIRSEHARFKQDTVDTPPDRYPAAARFDMQVGRPGRCRFAESPVDEIDDGRFKGEVLDMVDVFLIDLGRTLSRSTVEGLFMALEKMLDPRDDLADRGNPEVDLALAGDPQRRQCRRILGIGDCKDQVTWLDSYRQDAMIAHEPGRDAVREE